MARVMVVDDEKNLLESLGRILIGEGYEVKSFLTGLEALNSLEAFVPDVILLDVKMPEMDGLEVCRRIRANKNERIKSTPIIMVTGYYGEKEEVLRAGADDFLEKPIDRADAIIRVRCVLRIGKLADELERTKAYLEELRKAGKI